MTSPSFPKPVPELFENTYAFESRPMVKPTGFREYDARWLFGKELNLMGVQAVGMGLGTLIKRSGKKRELVTGHDFRGYSASIKMALVTGLMATGIDVTDIGLCLSPMAYHAQFALDIEAVAMVTASHNDNGWTGIKMGMDRPKTFGPDEMQELKRLVLNADFDLSSGGAYRFVDDFRETYLSQLVTGKSIQRPLKVVAACGNGTAGAFAKDVLTRLGCEVIELDCTLDHTFPRYNPNPEDLDMLHAMRDGVLAHGADVGFGFDGDGDRCGVVDHLGHEIFADKIGAMLARDIARQIPQAKFVVDVKSTGIYAVDPVLKAAGAETIYWKTGHSYMKRHVADTGAVAGFEKSGHFFFNHPYGLGYDDGFVAAIAICHMLNNNPDKSLHALYADLPQTFSSPTMSPHCADEVKYDVVARVIAHFEKAAQEGQRIAGQGIDHLVTVNGVRIALEDGSWGLVRASSNKPELVVVVESVQSPEHMKAIFDDLDSHLQTYPEIGAYNQKI